MRADITQAADLATRYGGTALFLVSLATLAWVPGCFIDRSGTRALDGGGVDSGTIDAGTGCPMTLPPPPEICGNMIDDDCDMAIDEGCVCEPLDSTQPCGDDTGECMGGMQTCMDFGWGLCEGAVGPGTETCNNLDDDCDGATDEALGSTTCGVGACEATVMNCVGGVTQVCMPGTPGTETCNAMDDDCDGDTDEGATCGMCVQQNRGTRSYLFCFDAAVRRNWDDARAYCMMFGYDLVTVEDSGEDDWLRQRERSLDRNDRDWWYGGSDAAMEGTWRWVPTMMDFGSHESWTGGGEPNGGEAENCLSSKDRGSPEWSSRDCSESLRFACEAQGS